MSTKSFTRRRLLGWTASVMTLAAASLLGAVPAQATEHGPVRIGVITWLANPLGAGIMQGAELAASEINAAGGIDGRNVELLKYDDHASAADGVRAIQRAAKQDHVVALVGGFLSEVVLAVEPWAARLHMPYIAGAASNKIASMVHNDYRRYKYVFEQTPNSYYIAHAVCDISHAVLVKHFGFKTAVIMSEDAAWTKPLDHTYEQCLPKAGFRVVAHIRFSPTTSDFTPIFDKIKRLHAKAIIGGLAHVGLKPTVQWHNQHVPALLAGFNAQATPSNFWARSNGATEGVITWNAGAPGAAVTPKSIPFIKAYQKRFGTTPTFEAYMTYDSMYAFKQAIERAHSTRPDALVAALEKTNIVGTMGRMEFYGRDARFTHDIKYGPNLITGVGIQWQNGKQIVVWPPHAVNGKAMLPSFVHASN